MLILKVHLKCCLMMVSVFFYNLPIQSYLYIEGFVWKSLDWSFSKFAKCFIISDAKKQFFCQQ